MKNLFKKLIVAIVSAAAVFSVAIPAFAIPLTVPQGGSGAATLTGILQGNGTAPFSAVTIGSGLNYTGGTLSTTGTGAGAVELGGSQTGFTNGMIQYIDGSGLQGGDTFFTRDSSFFTVIGTPLASFIAGDPSHLNNGITLLIDDQNNQITADSRSGTFTAGDIGNFQYGTKMLIDDLNKRISFNGTYNSVLDSSILRLNFNGGDVYMGDVSASNHNTLFSVSDDTQEISAQIDGVFKIQDTAGNRWFDVEPTNHLVQLGDFPGSFNNTDFTIDDTTSYIQARGTKGISQSSVSFSGSGSNDLTPSFSSYTGTNGNTFTVTITNINTQNIIVSYTSGGPFTSPSSVTDTTSGDTADIFDVSGGGLDHIRIENATGVFQVGDTVDDGAGNIATITSANPSLFDLFSWSNTDGNSGIDATIGTTALAEGVSATWGAATGHVDGDNWTWNYTFSFGQMLALDGLNRTYGIGDLSGVGNHNFITVNDGGKAININSSAGNTVIGDQIGFGNSTILTVDDANKQIIGDIRANGYINLGDVGGAGNGARISINDSNSQIQFSWNVGSYIFPVGHGTGGQVMTDDGNGNLYWAAGGVGGSITAGEVGYGDPSNLLTSDDNFTWDATNKVFAVGDLHASGNSTFFIVQDNSQQIYAATNGKFFVTDSSTTNKFFQIDVANSLYQMGDIGVVQNGVLFTVDDTNKLIVADSRGGQFYAGDYTGGGNGQRLLIDDTNSVSKIGDYGNKSNGTSTIWDDGVPTILNLVDGLFSIKNVALTSTVFAADPTNVFIAGGDTTLTHNGTRFAIFDGFRTLDFAAPLGVARFGDIDSLGNGTIFTVDDSSQNFTANTSGSFFITNTGSGHQVLFANTTNLQVFLGDVNGTVHSTTLKINDNAKTIIGNVDTSFLVQNNAGRQFIWADIANNVVYAGDVNGTGNGTVAIINDAAHDFRAQANGHFYVQNQAGHPSIDVSSAIKHVTIGDTDLSGNLNYFSVDDSNNDTRSVINGSGFFSIKAGSNILFQMDAANQRTKMSGALALGIQYAAPATGATVTSTGEPKLVLNPAGALLALTVNFPPTPINGQVFDIASTQPITTLTLATGTGSILGTLTTIATNGFAGWVYSTTAASWVRDN